MAGTWGSPYKVANLASWNLGTYGIVSHYGMVMNAGDSTGTEASPNCTSPTTICGNTVMTEGGATQFGRRLSNTVQYWTPVIGGFQARIATQLGGLKSPDGAVVSTDPALYSFSVQWTGGPFTVAGAYEMHEEFRSTGVAGAPRPTDTAYMIGGKWSTGAFSIGAAFEQLEYENSSAVAALADNFKRQNYVINGTFRLGNGEIFAGYSYTPGNDDCGAGLVAAAALLGSDCESATEVKFLSAGYAHNLSKRTKAYFMFGNIDNGIGQAVYYIAGPAANAAGGTGGLLAGTDVQTFGIGVQHSF
jgi:predicted porin